MRRVAFYTAKNAHLGENYVRFIVCKTDEQLDLAESRLQKLRALVGTPKTQARTLI